MSSSAVARNHYGQQGGLGMPVKNLNAPDIAGLVRGAAAGGLAQLRVALQAS
jgi:hypothetical protein